MQDRTPVPYPVPQKYIETPPGRDPELPVLAPPSRRGVPTKDCFAYGQITKYKKRYLTVLEEKVRMEAERNAARTENFKLRFNLTDSTNTMNRLRHNMQIIRDSEKKYFDRWVGTQNELEAVSKSNAELKLDNEVLQQKLEQMDGDFTREMNEKDDTYNELIKLRHTSEKMLEYINRHREDTSKEKTLEDFRCGCAFGEIVWRRVDQGIGFHCCRELEREADEIMEGGASAGK